MKPLTAKEFVKKSSPTKWGIRNKLEELKLDNIVYGLMERYAEHHKEEAEEKLVETRALVIKKANELIFKLKNK